MKVSSVVNLLARSFLVFLISYLWIGYYVRAAWAVFLLSFGITATVNTLFWWAGTRKNTRITLTREKREHMRRVILQLKFMSLSQTLLLFKRAFMENAKEKAPQNEIKKLAKKLVLSVEANSPNKIVNFFPLFHKEVNVAEVISCINSTAADATTWIASESFPPAIHTFIRTLKNPVHLIDGETAYEILAKSQTFPELTVRISTKKRPTLREINDLIFSRVRFRNYVIMGTVILLTSFIVRFNIYYIIIATIVFGLALVSLLAKPKRPVI